MSPDMTPKQYLYGVEDEKLGKKPVKDILGSAVSELEMDKARTFSFSNLDLLKSWWETQPVTKKLSVKDLIINKQLEIVGGAFSEQPEIDSKESYRLGREFLIKELEISPKIDWLNGEE